MRIFFERVSDRIRAQHASWSQAKAEWAKRAQDARDLYYSDRDNTGTNYNLQQIKKIKDTTNIPVSINFVYPIINQKLSLLVQNRPSMQVVSVSGKYEDEAATLDKMKHGIFLISGFDGETEEQIKDQLITGQGVKYIHDDDFYSKNEFGMRISYMPVDEVLFDANSKRKTLSDQEGMFVQQVFTKAKAMQLFGHIIRQLKDEQGQPVTLDRFTNSSSWTGDSYIPEYVDVNTVDLIDEGKIYGKFYYTKVWTRKFIYSDLQGNPQRVFEDELTDEEKNLMETVNYEIEEGVFVRLDYILGDYKIAESFLDIHEYPFEATFYEWGGRPYRSYGLGHFLRGMQEGIDKAIHLMILNGILTNNAGWTAPKGSIGKNDKPNWTLHANNPTAIKEYTPKVIDNVVLKPERDHVPQLSNFFPTLIDMLKNGMEYVSGINAIVAGNAQEAKVEVFSSLQQYQTAAMQRVILTTKHINESARWFGDVLIDYMVSRIKPNNYFYFDEEEGEVVNINVAKKLATSIKLGRYRLVTVNATSMPTQKMAIATELLKIAQSSSDPVERSILTQKGMLLAGVKEFKQIKDEIDTAKRIASENESLKEDIERLKELNKQMENKMINTEINNKVLEGQINLMKNTYIAEGELKATVREKKKSLTKSESDS